MKTKPMIMPYKGYRVPHGVLEVNQKCNISCEACYKDKLNYTKPLDQIKKEIDLFTKLRKLSVLTLAGGEPTLHPQLPEVIKYICGKKIQVQMLSNGFALTEKLLKEYKNAGLKEILLHIDSKQKRSDASGISCEQDLMPLRNKKAEKINNKGIISSLELTLYKGTLNELPLVINFVLTNPIIYRLLITCYHDMEKTASAFKGGIILGKKYPDIYTFSGKPQNSYSADTKLNGEEISLKEVENKLNKMGMQPFGYVASNLDNNKKRWLFYYSFVINFKNGKCKILHLSPTFKRVVNISYKLNRLLNKPYTFACIYTSFTCVIICLLYAVTSLSFREIGKTFLFILNLFKRGAKIHHKSFTFQEGHNITEKGELEHCKDCPDATIRCNTLIPVCLVDFFFPPETS